MPALRSRETALLLRETALLLQETALRSREPALHRRQDDAVGPPAGGEDGAARSRPDGCPGALQVHDAADGGLARVRLPGGRLDVAALRALSDAAGVHGDPALELTSRGNLQLRGLAPDDVERVAGRVAAAGLLPSARHERARNVVASPLSGRAGGLLDVRGWVRALDAGLCADAGLAELPGRFLLALDDGRGDVRALGADVGLTAVAPAGPGSPPAAGRGAAAAVALELAGEDTGLRCRPEDAVALALVAARAFLEERRAQGGTAWRVADLADGSARIAHRLARAGGRLVVAAHPAAPAGPVAATDPTAAAAASAAGTPAPAGSTSVVGEHAQRDGRVALGVVVPLGLLGPDRVAALARHCAGEVLLTPWRAVVLPDLEAGAVAAARADLAATGMVADAGSPWTLVTACAGRPGCSSAHADVRAAAAAAVATGRVPGPPGRRVHWSGCERRCGRPRSEVLDVVAAAGGALVVGGAPAPGGPV